MEEIEEQHIREQHIRPMDIDEGFVRMKSDIQKHWECNECDYEEGV